MINFAEWLKLREMAVQHHFQFANDEVPNQDSRDTAGFKMMSRPAFRRGDRMLIIRDSPQVEQWMNAATEPFGVHWIIGYVEPEADAKEQDPDSWEKYSSQGHALGQQWMDEFQKNKGILPPPSPENTIVYIKPTSRLHPMKAWQQMHNFAHAVWNFNKPQREQFSQELRNAVRELQQKAYTPQDPEPPTEDEIVVILARLLDNEMLQRALTIDDIQNTIKTSNSGWNSFDEVMYDTLTSFFRNKGKISLRPRGPGKVYQQDRSGDMQPNPQITQYKKVRGWAWSKLLADQPAWDQLSTKLSGICREAIKLCVWSVIGGPIYPYRKLQTLP